jgi:hypothetical protein
LHFLTCTDAKRWKTGKRKAEKDEVIGAAIFGVVQVPEKQLDALQLYVLVFADEICCSFTNCVNFNNFVESRKRMLLDALCSPSTLLYEICKRTLLNRSNAIKVLTNEIINASVSRSGKRR